MSLAAGTAGAQEFQPPKLVERVAAVYPQAAARAGLTGAVTLELIVDAEGRVAEATVIAPAGHGFDEAALAAVERFRFAPGLADGKPVPVKVTYRYAFMLRGPAALPRVRLRPRPTPRSPNPPARQGPRARHAHAAGDGRGIAVDDRGALLAQTETAVDGSFALRLGRAGAITVVIAAPDHKTLHSRETLAAARR